MPKMAKFTPWTITNKEIIFMICEGVACKLISSDVTCYCKIKRVACIQDRVETFSIQCQYQLLLSQSLLTITSQHWDATVQPQFHSNLT